jgi:exosortase
MSIAPVSPAPNATVRNRLSAFLIGAALLLAAFSPVLWLIARQALQVDLQQHIFLVPFISGYLVWHGRDPARLPCLVRSSRLAAALTALVGLCAGATGWQWRMAEAISQNDALSLGMFSFLTLLLALALSTLGWTFIRPHLFAIGFLVFAIPMPDSLIHASSVFLQHASADAAQWMLWLAQTPVVREGLLFHIPGLDFLVAEECSGIRATFVLFMASPVAAQMLLRSRFHKLLLVAAVLPIAILRNGFRIASLTWLTVHVNSSIIDGPLHHRGGPIFFLLGLIPFLGFLWWMCRREDRQKPLSHNL